MKGTEEGAPVLDREQERASLEDRNTAVSAGAGSGKTTVLAERYVRLVTGRGLAAEEILTLTFTRKAAAEMYARIYRRLAESDHPLARRQLREFSRARISTLDSFSAALTRGGASRYGIPADFRIDENALALAAEETAVEVVMKHRHEEAVQRLVAARSFEGVIRDLFAGIGLNAASFSAAAGFHTLAEAQIDFLEKEIRALCRGIDDALAVIAGNGEAAADPSKTAVKVYDTLKRCFPLGGNGEPGRIDAEGIGQKAALLGSKEFPTIAKNWTGKHLVWLRPHVGAVKQQARLLEQMAGTLLYREDMLSLGSMLDEYAGALLNRKRRSGLLSYRDTAELALDILKNDHGLRNYYKGCIKAIMIDEFQDNNRLQKELLYLISEKEGICRAGIPEVQDLEPRKLFFVGDDKQSIYRYRGADVSVFRNLSRELASVPAGAAAGNAAAGGDISLNTNYRSTPALTEFFNALFPGVFGRAERDYEAEFRPILPGPERRGNVLPAPGAPVEIWLRDDGEDEEGDEEDGEAADFASPRTGEALAAAQRIAAGAASGEFGFGDIAVLFRSTGSQHEYERVFREAGIPFAAADPRGIYSEGPANDFYAILRLCLFPADSNAYATVLRSPFAGIGDETFLRIMLDRPAERGPFPEEAPDSWFESAEAERARFRRGREIFTILRGKIDVEGLGPILSWLWDGTGYRSYLLHHPPLRPTLEHFEYLYALALDADRRKLCLSAFLDELAPLIGSLEKTETGDLPERKDAVTFMTVHKSKGLEFPVVIIPCADARGREDGNRKPYYLDPIYGPVINFKSDTERRDQRPANYFYERQKKDADRQEEAELKRLLYVAATRAERRLLVFGARKRYRDEEIPPPGGPENPLPWRETDQKNEPRLKKTFMDLLSAGFTAAGGAVPGAVFKSWEIPGYDAYRNALDGIRRLLGDRGMEKSGGTAAPTWTAAGVIGEFFAREIPPPPRSRLVHTSPTALEKSDAKLRGAVTPGDGGQKAAGPDAGTREAVPGEKDSPTAIDHYMEEAGDRKGRTRFGTLCHRAIELILDGTDPAGKTPAFAEILEGEARRIFGGGQADRESLRALTEEALAQARNFLESPLGQEAAGASRRCSEFRFVLPVRGEDRTLLVSGSIDLICENGGRCTVIDFKTDRRVDPDAHRIQMACYRKAAPAFSALPVRTVLFYLRQGLSREIEADIPDGELCRIVDKTINE
ncbi:MAG: UvrD-helicase domain-containing protein [Treponema sp.]|jgi:ATP-dependent helicase/nuclease subunit A|nr:UvrD-helicase domain-containing protein [Treponema sp.]